MPTSILLKQNRNWNIGEPFTVSILGPGGEETEVAQTGSGPRRIQFPLRINIGFDLGADTFANHFPIEVMTIKPSGPGFVETLLNLEANGHIDAVPVELLKPHRGFYERVVKRGEKGDQFVLADLLGRTKGTFPGQDDFIRRLMMNPDFEVKQMAISAAARMAHVFPKLREELESIAKGNDEAAEWASDRLRVLAAGPEWRDLL